MDRGRSKNSRRAGAARAFTSAVNPAGRRTTSSSRSVPRPEAPPEGETARLGTSIEDILIARAIPELADRHAAALPERPFDADSRAQERIPAFVDALLDERSERWQVFADEALSECRNPQTVAATLFHPAARVIGDRWRSDEADFLKVTIAVTRMQRSFNRMAHDHPPAVGRGSGRRMLLAPTPGDQHAFGLSVVADAFRRAGWDVDCCACDEGADLFRLAGANDYLIIGLSVNIGRLLPDLTALVARLRAQSPNRSVVLMGGGSLFADHPGWASDAGFDLSAADALSAVALAEAAVASRFSHDDLQMAAE